MGLEKNKRQQGGKWVRMLLSWSQIRPRTVGFESSSVSVAHYSLLPWPSGNQMHPEAGRLVTNES